MAEILWPEDLPPYAISFFLQPHIIRSESPFTHDQKLYGLEKPRWACQMSFRGGDGSNWPASEVALYGQRLDSLIGELEGGVHHALLWDFRRDTETAGLVNSTIRSGLSTVTFTSGTPVVGEYVGGDGTPHLITNVFEVSAGTLATVRPPFISHIAEGGLSSGKVTGRFRLSSNEAGANFSEVGQLTHYSLDFFEDPLANNYLTLKQMLGGNLYGYWHTGDTGAFILNAGNVNFWYGDMATSGWLDQASAANQPAYSSGLVTFDGTNDVLRFDAFAQLLDAVDVPDASNGDTGKGFTITGLARARDGTWWAANDGRNVETGGNGLWLASIVHLSADFTTKLGEILATDIDPSIAESLQGLVVANDGTLWVADITNMTLWHFTPAGTLIGSIVLTYEPNALGYDPDMGVLVVGRVATEPDPNTLEWITPNDGTVLKSIETNLNADHVWIEGDDVYYTFGGTISYVVRHHVTDGGIWRIAVPDADEIEGIVKDGDTLYLANDAYFHAGDPALNRVLKYRFYAPPTEFGSKWSAFGIARIPTSIVTTHALLAVRDPLNSIGWGIYFTGGSTAELRTIVNTTDSALTEDTVNFAVTTTTEFMFYFLYDLEAETVSLWINGVQVGTAQALTNSTGTMPVGELLVGAARESGSVTRFSNVRIRALGTAKGDYRETVEGVMAWDTGRQNLLPSDHPYKNSRP